MTTHAKLHHPQPGILLPPPPAARYLEFDLAPDAPAAAVREAIAALVDGPHRADGASTVLGLGPGLVRLLGIEVSGLRPFAAVEGPGVAVPATPHDLWLWLRGEDRGELLHRGNACTAALAPALRVATDVDAFIYLDGRDLTGYVDGTENPQSGDATRVAVVADAAVAPPGSSLVSVQRWEHDFAAFAAMPGRDQDMAIGRERESNEEINDAPPRAHVKRTAQEGFDPTAFLLRRSMPWSSAGRGGLMFVAFGATLDPFERQLRRMAGLDDGIVDALFGFTRPVTGATYWCPPLQGGRLALG